MRTFKISTSGFEAFDKALEAKGYRMSLIDGDSNRSRELHITEWIRADRIVIVGRVNGSTVSVSAELENGFLGEMKSRHGNADTMIAEIEEIYGSTVMVDHE
jgi:hypothetical protein